MKKRKRKLKRSTTFYQFALGTEYLWGFIPDKKQPKSIAEIMLEKLLEEKRKAQQ